LPTGCLVKTEQARKGQESTNQLLYAPEWRRVQWGLPGIVADLVVGAPRKQQPLRRNAEGLLFSARK